MKVLGKSRVETDGKPAVANSSIDANRDIPLQRVSFAYLPLLSRYGARWKRYFSYTRYAANSTERETFCGETEARIDDARINYRRERLATRKR